VPGTSPPPHLVTYRGPMAADGRRRVWPQRVSAGAAWLLAVYFLLAIFRYYLTWPLAGLLCWLAIGVWKGRRRRAIAVVALGVFFAVWYACWAVYSATWSEMVVIRQGAPDQLMEVRRPTWWTVALGIEAALALIMALAALPAARGAGRASQGEPATTEPVEA
jgi:hypothetical protein